MKDKVSFKEIVFGIILFLLGVFMVLYSKTFPKAMSGGDVLTGPGFFPTIIGILMATLGLYTIFINFFKKNKLERKAEMGSGASLKGKELLNFSLFIVFTAIYPAVINLLGFFIGAFLFCFILMKVLQAKWVSAVVSSLVLVAIVYIIFERIAHIPLPIGAIFGG